MKKLLSVLLACILALGITVPVLATPTVGDYITVGGVRYLPGQEVTGLRDQYSKTIYNGDDNLARTIYLGSIHYEDDFGDFYPIDTTIVPSDKPNWDWEVTTGHWKLFVNDDTTIGVKKGDNWIGTRLHGIAYLDIVSKDYTILQTTNTVTPVVNGNTITWYDILYGVDYVLYYTNDSLKEEVVIHQEARDLLNSAGHRPSDYGYSASNTYLVPIFECDWSDSLPLKLNGNNANPDELETDGVIHFEANTPDLYWNTKLVSFLPVYSAISVNPINPQDPEEEWEYAEVVMKKRLVKRNDKHWLLTGVPVLELNSMPEGSIVFDPTETLRPDGAGDYEEFHPGGGTNWTKVDEAISDEGATALHVSNSGVWHYDAYNLAAPVNVIGTINSVAVYWRWQCTDINYAPWTKPGLRLGTDETWGGDIQRKDFTWTTYGQTISRPGGGDWAVADLADLQVGIGGRQNVVGTPYITQVYVVVNYTPQSPTVTTQAVTDILSTTAIGNGNITSIGSATPDKRGIVYGTTSKDDPGDVAPPGGYDDYEEQTGSFGVGAFTRSLTELTKYETYYVRAYAHNTYGYSYGAEVTFDTLMTAPAIDSEAATYVAKTTARLNSTVTDDGGQACDIRFGYGDETQVAGNAAFELYDTKTDWVLDTYTTGQHPYVNIEGLTPNDEYFYRVQIKNDDSTVTSTTEQTFTTELAFDPPSNLKAYPGSTTVGLTWTKGDGAARTMIRYSEVTYPTDETEGTLSYLGTLASHTITGLTPGHTYCIVAISSDDGNYGAPVQVMASTSAAEEVAEAPDAPSTPTGWFQSPNYTVLEALPLYDQVNDFFDAFELPRASGWFFSAILGCAVIGAVVFVISRHPTPAVIALAVSLAIASIIKLLPLYMMAFSVVFIIGVWQFGRER